MSLHNNISEDSLLQVDAKRMAECCSKKKEREATRHPLQFFLLTLLLLHYTLAVSAQSNANLTLGTTLSPLGPKTFWLSPSGDFAFGFHPLETDNTLFLLAIWFDKTAEKTLVWYANGDNPVTAQSKLELTTDGQLSLKAPTGLEVWNPGAINATYAAILDTGNLVLVDSNSSHIWQSFSSPTDTMLPNQILELNTRLWSRLMDTDYSRGRFSLSMQNDGNLLVALPTGNNYGAYWASNTLSQGKQLIFNNSGIIYLVLENETRQQFTSGSSQSMIDFYQRGTLDPDGVFRHYVHPKNASGGEGWTAVDFLPSDICQVSNTMVGSGTCGFNSYCYSTGTASQRVECVCPPQYSFLDPSRKYKGCKPNFQAQSCEKDESSLYQFSEIINLDWPQMDYEMYNPIDEAQCRNLCLSDCFCAVVIFNAENCWKKKLPLSNGRMGSYVQRHAFIKVPKEDNNNSQPNPPALSTGRARERKRPVLLRTSVLATSVFVNILLVISILVINFWLRHRRMPKLQPEGNSHGRNLRRFTYGELKEATKDFNEELGRGSFGIVYKGYYLQSESQTCVAVKRLDKLFQDTEKEFMNEIRSIGQTNHKNLVRLLGFCNKGTERMLVYELMNNGSLRSFLFSDVRPNWSQRIEIARRIARGLHYLHEECSSQIIHCDIKPENVLLDDNFEARISDFGLAKLLRAGQSKTNTGIRGSRGYVAPEWFKPTPITAMVDVYSYGVMLMEIICCRKNIEEIIVRGEEVILTFWAYDCYKDGKIEELVEGDEEAMGDIGRVEKFMAVAIWCIQEEPALRPSMHRMIQMLDGSVTVPVPPDPSP